MLMKPGIKEGNPLFFIFHLEKGLVGTLRCMSKQFTYSCNGTEGRISGGDI